MKEVAALEELLGSVSVGEGLREVAERYPGKVVFSTSMGQEDQVLTDLIAREALDISIFTLDTGRLFAETYELIEITQARYNKEIRVYFPQASSVEDMVREGGINLFYNSVEERKRCCHVRKVEPLNRALQGAAIWVTGLRASQTVVRHDLPLVEWLEDRQLIKYNPLLHWSYEEVMEYIKLNAVPYNPLHDKGFVSIGCAPCTRATQPDEDPRAGRWWWEATHKECGLHVHK